MYLQAEISRGLDLLFSFGADVSVQLFRGEVLSQGISNTGMIINISILSPASHLVMLSLCMSSWSVKNGCKVALVSLLADLTEYLQSPRASCWTGVTMLD